MAIFDQLFPTIGKPQVLEITDSRYDSIRKRYPAAPPDELSVFWWLETRAHYQENIDFYYQADALGGRNGRGFVIDFLVLRDQHFRLAIEVQGVAFHAAFVHGEPVAIKVYDRIKRQVLEAHGYRVVWVSDTKLAEALDDTMKRVLAGQDVL